MTNPMSPDEEHALFADPDNQVPQGRATRRRASLGDPVPVRFPADLLEKVRSATAVDDRSVSGWIRRAVEHEPERETT